MYGGMDYSYHSQLTHDPFLAQRHVTKRRQENDYEVDAYGKRQYGEMPFNILEEEYEVKTEGSHDDEEDEESFPESPSPPPTNEPYVTMPNTPAHEDPRYNQQKDQHYQNFGQQMYSPHGQYMHQYNPYYYQHNYGHFMQPMLHQQYQHSQMHTMQNEQNEPQYNQLPIQPQPMQLDQTQSMQQSREQQQHPLLTQILQQPQQPPCSPATTQALYFDAEPNQYPPSPSSNDSAPVSASPSVVQYDQSKPVLKALIPMASDKDTVTRVTSHMMLIGCRKISVLVGEILRRSNGPERMNEKMIARLTRHAKTSARAFQRKMIKHKFDLNDIDRNVIQHVPSIISTLLEADAQLLAKDLSKVMSSELSKYVLGSVIGAAVMERGCSPSQVKESIPKIIDLLWCARAHLQRAGRDPADVTKALAQSNCPDMQAVCNFSLWTHGFGPSAVAHVIESLITVLKQFHSLCPTEETIRADFVHPSRRISVAQPSRKKIKLESEIDPFILSPLPDDLAIYDDAVLPRIGYDTDYIKVTVGELRRRILGPEKLNASLVCAFLRKAKNKDTLPDMRIDIEKIGIDLPNKSKKMVQPSSWCALSEQEAMGLARETAQFLFDLPASKEMKENTGKYPGETAWLRLVVESISEAMGRVGKSPEERNVETVTDLHLLRFAMVSHHFGHSFYASVMQWLQQIMC